MIRALQLERHGLDGCTGPPFSRIPSADGPCALLSRDLERNVASLEAFARGDGLAWPGLVDRYRRSDPHLLRGLATGFPQLSAGAGLTAALRRDVVGLARLGSLPVRRLGEEQFSGEGGRRLADRERASCPTSRPRPRPAASSDGFLPAWDGTSGLPFRREELASSPRRTAKDAFADQVEERVERVAPGFRRLARRRHVMAPGDFERRNANLVGGAFSGGTAQLHQQLCSGRLTRSDIPRRPCVALRGLRLHPSGRRRARRPGASAALVALTASRRRIAVAAAGAAAAAAARVAVSYVQKPRPGEVSTVAHRR